MSHTYRCGKCGVVRTWEEVCASPCGCMNVRLYGTCDARHCRTLEQVNDELANVEMHDAFVERIFLTGADFSHIDLKKEPKLFGKKVEFVGPVTIWEEEVDYDSE